MTWTVFPPAISPVPPSDLSHPQTHACTTGIGENTDTNTQLDIDNIKTALCFLMATINKVSNNDAVSKKVTNVVLEALGIEKDAYAEVVSDLFNSVQARG